MQWSPGTVEEVRVEYRPLSSLRKAPRNPKSHDLDQIDTSIQRFGFVQPITIDERTGQLVAGHGRLEALNEMKKAGKAPPKRVKVQGTEWLVPVILGVSFASDAEAEAYLIADNRLVEIGGWDEKGLAEMLRGLPSFEGIGFDTAEIGRLLDEPPPDPEKGPAPEERATNYVAGPIKQIVLFFKSEEYDAMVTRFEEVAKAESIENDNTLVVTKLLEFYEANRSQPTAD